MEVNAITSQAAQDQFLQLLVTQLQNQDPLEPTDQEQFIGQLAQFSTLEGIENLNANFSELLQLQQDMLQFQQVTQGTELLGRTVRFTGTDGLTSGTVQGVGAEGGQILLDVDGTKISINDVTEVLI